MSDTEDFVAFNDGPAFNALFLGYLIVSGVLAVFFLLYFNRVFASVVSWVLRTWTWHQYRVYLDIQALQVSILGGRIFFTGLRYHGNNETILVQNGYITWSYWLRRVREVNIEKGKGPKRNTDDTSKDTSAKLPCRINVSLLGLEWFIYNRGPAYDSILAGLEDSEQQQVPDAGIPKDLEKGVDDVASLDGKPRRRRSRRFETSNNPPSVRLSEQKEESALRDSEAPLQSGFSLKGRAASVLSSGSERARYQDARTSDGNDELPLMLQLLPIHLECDKAALVMGNENTKAVLIVKAQSMSGEIDASETETPDPYRQFFRLNFKHPVVEMKENHDFKEEQADRAARERQKTQVSAPVRKRSFFHQQRRKVLGHLRNMVPYWRKSVESLSLESGRGIGTAGSQIPGSTHWQGLSRYLQDDIDDQKARWASVEYAAVPTILDSPEASLTIFWDVVGKVRSPRASGKEKAPEHLSNINGEEPPAWAINLSIKGGSRAVLQRTFVPSLCKDAVPAPRLPLGAWRVPTQFKLYVELEDSATIRIPVREESKNWKWKGKEPVPPKQGQRREPRKARGRSKKSDQPATVAANSTVSYSMDMMAGPSGFSNTLHISSSINHELLWRSGRLKVTCDLSNPLRENLELFILRDHVFLGPPADYLTFTPFRYHLDLQFPNVQLFLNLNDANIIDNPTDLEDNTYLIIASPLLRYRPRKNAIPFEVRAETASVTSFLTSKEIGQLENLLVDGKYHYNATTSPSNIDTLLLNVSAQSVLAHLHGFIKDNYFGDDIHFKTLEEYQDALQLKDTNPEAEAANKPPHKNVRVDDPKRHVQIDTACISADLRFTNYYMEMDLVAAPLNLSLGSTESGAETPISATSSTQLFVDGVNVYGHRLFGLPPTEPTYLCNWDIGAGAVTGECTTEFLTTLISGGKAFGFTFDDEENALVSFSSIVLYDITFLRVGVQSVSVWLHVQEAAFLLSTGSIDVNYNDWARTHYSKRANIRIPDIKLSCVNAESASRHKTRSHHPVETDALVETSVHVAIIGRKAHFSRERRLQQELVRREDQRTHRTPFLLLPGLLDDFVPDPVDPPAQSVPPVPLPIKVEDCEADGTSLNSQSTSKRSRRLQRKSSFLSFSGSDQSSILRPHSSSRRSTSAKPRLANRLLPQHSSGRDGRPSVHTRDFSASSRHSAFYSASGDHAERQDVFHNTVAFSSQYFAPYFPLENVRPNCEEALKPSIEKDHEEGGEAESVGFDLGDIDPDNLSEDCAYSSTLLEFPSGLTVFCNATSLRHVASLLSALQPSDPDTILDTLQVDSMKEIFGMQKDQKMEGHIKDVLVRLPRANIRFINSSDLDSPDPAVEEQDQYDMTVTRLALASRTETRWEDAFKPGSKSTRSSLHLRLNSVQMSAAEKYDHMESSQAAVLAQIEKVMVSMGTKDVAYLDIDVGNIQGSTSSGKVEYLASLIHRSSILAADLGKLFTETMSQGEIMAKDLVRRLAVGCQNAPDPPFLVRPSAVLRSAPHHLRTFDSWKLIMRLRQMWTIQSPSARERIRFDCLSRTQDIPPKLRQQVIAAFEQWRSWDLGDISESVLLNSIFGPPEHGSKPSADDKPTLAVGRIKQFQIVLDPGPKQNEVSLVDLTARLQTKATTAPKERVSIGSRPVDAPLTVVNIYCADAAINLNWELCELADDILRLVNKMQKQPATPTITGPTITGRGKDAAAVPASAPGQSSERIIHCVCSLGRGYVAMEAVNIHASSFGDGMKASLLVRTGANNTMDTNFILSCDTVTSSLKSHSQALSKFVLEKPSFLLSHELQTTKTTDSHTIKATASSQHLSLVVKQDPVNLVEVLDLVVRDELAQLYRLKEQLPSSPRSTSTPSNKQLIVDRLSAFRVNVAMFMDQYTISLPLLRSLTYTINGTVARAAMAANFGREIIFDFDVKENSHDMQIKVNNVSRSISLLQIPPTNGRIRSHMDKGEHSVSVFASLELVQLDASAVYSLLTALNRPEISDSINELQRQGKLIQEHIREVVGDEQTPISDKSVQATAEEESAVLAYAIHLTFAGLEVFGNSPLKSETCPVAHISFALDSIHLEMANRVEQHGPILTYPEFHANLRQIAFEIQKGSDEAMNSCGNLAFGALITASSRPGEGDGVEKRYINVKSDAFEVNLSPDTASTVVDVLGYMGDKIKDLDTSRELQYLRKLRQTKPRIAINDAEQEEEADIIETFLSSITYTFEICNIQLAWLVNSPEEEPGHGKEDLVLSLQRIEFGTRTRNSARLTIENLQLQMVSPLQQVKKMRSPNSALLPEVIFNIAYVSTADARRLAFQAVGKSLDLRITSGFIIPAAHLNDSITLSVRNAQQASQHWNPAPITTTPSAEPANPAEQAQQRNVFGSRRLESLLVDADFAGAVVYLTGKKAADDVVSATRSARPSLAGKYGQVHNQDESASSTTLRSPGLAWKMEYRDNGNEDPSLYAEVKIDASSNILYPSVVPLIVDISNSIKQVVSTRDDHDNNKPLVQPQEAMAKIKPNDEDKTLNADPTAVLGRMKLNLGLRILRQEFSLSCQPIARVAATASFEDVYFTANTVRSIEQGNFFAISGAFTNLQASVQHVYSRESTGSFKVQSIVLSLMNSKHVSGTNGLSAILKVSPMEVSINAKQLQDFMLFREIWVPSGIRESASSPSTTVPKLVTETSQGHLVQRYQQVAATAAFPWTATISIAALDIVVDLGQALGKSTFSITEFWISSKKTSDWEQNLCLGFQKIGVDSVGRMSGFVALQDFKLRTSIQWPEREAALNETPMIQASVGFSQFRVKAAFDYQAFLVADITSMEFLMYNVRRSHQGSGDRLVASFDGGSVQVFGTTTSAAQGRLVQERKASFETSLREIEKFMRRKFVSGVGSGTAAAAAAAISRRATAEKEDKEKELKSPISLDTDVVVTLKALNLGVFPSTFSDHQVFKMEALNAQARFAASVVTDEDHFDGPRIHSILGLTLGQLRIGLAGVRSPSTGGAGPKTLSELSVEDVVQSATGSRGGTILKVPQVEAVMQTWQQPESKHIDYIFKSAFEGKVEVGWNYSRISYIRGMWANHSKTLATAYGKELPAMPMTSAIKITGAPEEEGVGGGGDTKEEKKEEDKKQQQKITAEVKVPQSKYEYNALEPPVIETPQLRDMGEATPPLEWIGLHRDRLPNLTHQIVIVALLELAGEVEDAYSRILGSS
ncbi:protein CSF1 [Diplogelasinospora grovesii]|uniref:Protein CSF1 n=1 Tax=Diplogelasinospora grovesii TaxID=303347 RepID=A0AAN6NFN9_9PEZI|nr:protein CSF1 [Diplogelasinospora grovesii]